MRAEAPPLSMVQAMQRASLPNHSVILVLLYGPSDCTPEGQVAQLVEHRTENAGVAGSIPALATIRRLSRRSRAAAKADDVYPLVSALTSA